jgi:transcriptional regulator with XRE-family HTH domain
VQLFPMVAALPKHSRGQAVCQVLNGLCALARRRAGMTLEQVAAKMDVSQPSLARVEASLGSHRHSPSLEMLRKYAAAVNCKLEIRLLSQHS